MSVRAELVEERGGTAVLKVLHVYRTYFPETQGGLQEAIRQTCRGLAACGADTTVFTLAVVPVPAQVYVPEGLIVRCKSVIELASCDIGSPLALLAFRRLAQQADIINFHYPWPFGDLLAILAAGGKPYVITYHSDIVRQRLAEYLYAPLRRLFFRRASAIVTTSPVYALTSNFLSRLRRPVEMIPLSIDEATVSAVAPELLSRYRARFPQPFFFFVGVLRYYKGLEFLIEAARISGLRIVIAGDGPERSRLEALAADLSNVTFLGFVSDEDKFALIRLSAGVVFPSHLRAEAFGVTLLEGAVCGRPLISTEIGTGTSYVNIHEETGLVVPPADPLALAHAMTDLVADSERAQMMGAAARRRCLTLFNSRTVGAQYLDLYQSVLAMQKRSAHDEPSSSVTPQVFRADVSPREFVNRSDRAA